MAIRVILAGIAIAALSATAAPAMVRIGNDRGGQIGPYLQAFAEVRASGERVMIDGNCLSACTLVLGVIPPGRICVTRRARLGFHAAWVFGGDGRPVLSEAGTRLLLATYPARVRRWIARRGGLSRRLIYLGGRELRSMYHICH
jgi:hypothetical protein